MFNSIISAFSPRTTAVSYNALPDSIRDEILDAMAATSKTDIR